MNSKETLANKIINEINGIKRAYFEDIIGDKLEIIVLVKNNNGNEEYFWDNLEVRAVAPTVAGVTFNWYEGSVPSGPSVSVGAIGNGLTDGIFTVIATDDATGCF